MSGEQDITSEHPTIAMEDSALVDVVLRASVRTDTGLVREQNEDDFLLVPERELYLVADGMGGHNAGCVASRICVEAVENYFVDHDDRGDGPPEGEALERVDHLLAEALLEANRMIFRASMEDESLSGMGTTAVAARFRRNRLTVAHAGDSRAYLFRNGDLRQITADHSLSNFLRALGRDAEARLAASTMSNVIMRALGLEPEVEVESSLVTVMPGDRVLLCTDGLSDLVSEDDMSSLLMNPELRRSEVTERLIEAALDAGGRDNVTVMIVDVFEVGDPAAKEDSEEGDMSALYDLEE